mmetsp:Transcript_40102/g.106068  ORF Transcript_40102/g.106068 Transcript_40102/m.106068 type:complete len:279 (-) Transcript_40102:7-843(-)
MRSPPSAAGSTLRLMSGWIWMQSNAAETAGSVSLVCGRATSGLRRSIRAASISSPSAIPSASRPLTSTFTNPKASPAAWALMNGSSVGRATRVSRGRDHCGRTFLTTGSAGMIRMSSSSALSALRPIHAERSLALPPSSVSLQTTRCSIGWSRSPPWNSWRRTPRSLTTTGSISSRKHAARSERSHSRPLQRLACRSGRGCQQQCANICKRGGASASRQRQALRRTRSCAGKFAANDLGVCAHNSSFCSETPLCELQWLPYFTGTRRVRMNKILKCVF